MVKFIIDKRTSGKSTLARELFLKDPENSVLVIRTASEATSTRLLVAKEYKEKYSIEMPLDIIKKILTPSIDAFLGKKINNIIVDDCFGNKSFVNLYANMAIACKDLYVLGSFNNLKEKDKFKKMIDGNVKVTIAEFKAGEEKVFKALGFLEFYDKRK